MLCKNCQNEVSDAYCPHCGQKTRTSRISFAYLLTSLKEGVLQVDKGFFYTIASLFRRPGQLIRDYLSGKRKHIYNPITLIILLALIYSFISNQLNTETVLEDLLGSMEEGYHNYDVETDTNNDFNSIQTWLASNYQYSSLLFLPFLALASFFTFKKYGYNYVEHIVIHAFITAQRTIVFALLAIIRAFWNPEDVISLVIIALAILSNVWVFFALFNDQPPWKVSFRLLCFFILAVLFIFIGLLPVIALGTT